MQIIIIIPEIDKTTSYYIWTLHKQGVWPRRCGRICRKYDHKLLTTKEVPDPTHRSWKWQMDSIHFCCTLAWNFFNISPNLYATFARRQPSQWMDSTYFLAFVGCDHIMENRWRMGCVVLLQIFEELSYIYQVICEIRRIRLYLQIILSRV